MYRNIQKNEKIKKVFGYSVPWWSRRDHRNRISKKSPQILKMGAVLPRVGSVYRRLQLVAFADVGKVGTSGEGDNDASNDIFVE